jgi:pimeloyl-ACP methyl ester carboxylesterase
MRMCELKSEQVKVSGGEVSYLRIGNGLPLVLINGFGNHFKDWDSDFIEALSSDFELFLVNYRGVGKSFSTSPDSSIAGIASDIVEFIKVMSLKSVTVLGYSMGGYIAQEVALAMPQELGGLILIATRMGGPSRIMADQETLEAITRPYSSRKEELEAILKYLAPPELHERLRAHQREIGSLSATQDIQISDEARAVHNSARKAWLEEFGDKHLQYPSFSFATLILTGNSDRIFPAQNSVQLAGAISHCCMIRFPGGGHELMTQFPQEISALIDHFCKAQL